MPVLLTDTTDDGVRTLTLHRPEARNALSRQLIAELGDAIVAADRDDAVAVIVLTGTDPAFCAGLDLKELGQASSGLGSSAVTSPLPPTSKLVIDAVNGHEAAQARRFDPADVARRRAAIMERGRSQSD